MQKVVTLFFSIIFIASLMTAQEKNIVSGEVIVQLKPGYVPETLTSEKTGISLSKKELLSNRMNIWLFSYDPARIAADEVLYEIRSHRSVNQVQFNHYVTLREGVDVTDFTNSFFNVLSTPNDPRFNEQWALNNTGQGGGLADADIDAVEAWNLSTGGLTALGDTIVIAIVDGGCQLNHPDLNYWYNYHEIPGNNIDDDGNGYVDDFRGWNAYDNNGSVPSNSHGTHVSGIAAARGNNNLGVSGVNWNAKVMPIGGSSGIESVVIKAYGYVLEQRATYNETNGQYGAFVVVTNASFGVDYGQPSNYPLWCAIYDSLGVQGVLSCGATANANVNVDLQGDIPTACPSPYLISVTNTNNTDNKNSGAAYGLTTIDLGAPGTSILSTDLSSSYSTKTGTSMATPTVAGAVALMFAAANSGIMQSYMNNPSGGALSFKQFLLDGTDPISALNNITVTGGRLNIYNTVLAISTPPDSVAPTMISDLTVTGATSNSLTLGWTAPLDTTRNGVIAYDIRMSASPITDSASFYSAQSISYNQMPSPSGTPEALEVTGLTINTSYYFAVRSSDLWGNISAVSNSPMGTTYGAPEISVNPASLNIQLGQASSYTDTITVSNISTHNSTLDYSVVLDNNVFPTGSFSYKIVPAQINEVSLDASKDDPIEFNGMSIEGSGGPDLFGYEWIDSNEPDGPQYVWNDISSTGTAVTSWTPTGTYDPKDEGYAGPIALPFNFKFYGETKNQVYISSNGFITFSELTANSFTNSQIPSTSAPNGLIAGFWDDLDGRTQGTVYYKQVGNTFVIQYTNWQKYSAAGSLTFQYVLYSSGRVVVYYNNMNATLTSATVGIEGPGGIDGLQTAYNAAYVANNLALQFSADPDWLNVNSFSGRLYNGAAAKLVLSFNSADFPLGSYSMDVIINSNDPSHPASTVPVNMQIAVPVELSSLNAAVNNGSVVLTWTTASETNNRGFSVERKTENGPWEELEFVNGKGTTAEPVSYTFTDNPVNTGKLYYRLKQVDFDGSFEYSSAVEADVSLPMEYSLKQNYPNPFNPSTVIEYSVPEEATVIISVYTSLGQLLKTIVNEKMDAGFHRIEFNASEFTSGTYIYQLVAKGSGGSYIDSKKMIFIK